MSWRQRLAKEIGNESFSIRAFAKDANITFSNLHNILNGKTHLSVINALKIEKITNQPAEYWLEEQMKEELSFYRKR